MPPSLNGWVGPYSALARSPNGLIAIENTHTHALISDKHTKACLLLYQKVATVLD